MKYIFSTLALVSLTALFSCSDSSPAPVPLNAIVYKDLNADYAPFDFTIPTQGEPARPTQKRKYTFFSFKTGAVVANSDSATNKWDIGFRATSIIFNSGTSGPGGTQAQMVTGIFSELTVAPEAGYQSDNSAARAFVISSSPLTPGATTTNNWWQSTGSQNSTIVTPIPGRLIVIKTSDGRYAKMEILSYYKGAPVLPNNVSDLDRHYTFQYVYQPAASTSLK
ncbi:MAG: HmuY family protein [Cytophagales bacterium]